VLDPLGDAGVMPFWQSLQKKGYRSILESIFPPVTPPTWTSFMTGISPRKHGVLAFHSFNRETHTRNPSWSTMIRIPTIWEIFSDVGFRVGILFSPMTYPTFRVSGFMVSGIGCPSPDDPHVFYPRDFGASYPELIDYLHSCKIDMDWTRKSKKSFSSVAKTLIALLKRTGDLGKTIMKQENPDIGFLQFQHIDHFQHMAWPEIVEFDVNSPNSDIVREFYTTLDCELEKMVRFAEVHRAEVVFLSDHGFKASSGIMRSPNAALHKIGWLKLLPNPDCSPKTFGPDSIRLMHSVWRKFRTRNLRGIARSVGARFRSWRSHGYDKDLLSAYTFPNIDFDNSRAYCCGGELAGFVNVVLKNQKRGDWEERRTLAMELREQLSVLSLQDGSLLFPRIETGEAIFGETHDSIPDLVVFPGEGEGCVVGMKDVTIYHRGTHHPDGIFFYYGDVPSSCGPRTRIQDVSSTLLARMGVVAPNWMEGKRIEGIPPHSGQLKSCNLSKQRDTEYFNPDTEVNKLIEDRLRALGYLG